MVARPVAPPLSDFSLPDPVNASGPETLHTMTRVTSTDIAPISNLSRHTLTPLELTVLEKGLSYSPITRPDFFEIKIELQRFFRCIRLSNFYKDNPVQSPCSTTEFRPPSFFYPSFNRHAGEILTFEKMVLKDVETLSKGRNYTRFNFTYEENMALQGLKQRRDVVIKAADKVGGIVLQDIGNYKQEILRQLSDQDCYKTSTTDPTKQLSKEILELTTKGFDLGFISKKEYQFLNKKDPRIPVIYTLPKTHKNFTNPPGRPIVSGCGSISEPLCKYLDYFIKPFVPLTEAYTRDSMHVIMLYEGLNFSTETEILVTIDIQSLYTNIPQTQALATLSKILDTRDEPVQVPTWFLVEMMRIAMGKDYFMFDNQFYFHTKGVAMGATFAPNLANLYMADYEIQHIFSQSNPF
ncbi:hypothetical protein NDU88_006764 [Pleurodeles waltl]|uniref:Reverse transcriptase domain-containing protein n=1 Tax=Pleurodeles waltl TaxID=8319 RepID=A0AAV7X1L4_PLEWA|nr:hypothetical protein NDU88_006764 [Pleurodeles waltl]